MYHVIVPLIEYSQSKSLSSFLSDCKVTLFLLGEDVSEQTGCGSSTQCTWCCTELPINLGDICGGK